MKRIGALATVLALASCKGCPADTSTPQPDATPSAAPAVTPASSPSPSPTLTANSAAVMTRMERLGPKLDACMAPDAGQGALVVRPPSEMRVELTIEPDGQVAAAKITSQTGGSETLGSCVRDVLKRERFDPPAGGKRVVVNVPLRLPTGPTQR